MLCLRGRKFDIAGLCDVSDMGVYVSESLLSNSVSIISSTRVGRLMGVGGVSAEGEVVVRGFLIGLKVLVSVCSTSWLVMVGVRGVKGAAVGLRESGEENSSVRDVGDTVLVVVGGVVWPVMVVGFGCWGEVVRGCRGVEVVDGDGLIWVAGCGC